MSTTVAPANPDFERAVRESFALQSFMTSLEAELVAVRPGEVEIEAPFSEARRQQHGFLHAGVVTSIADSAAGYAALSMAPPGHDVLAVEFKISLLRPATSPRFRACGRVLRAGRTLTTAAADVFGLEGERRILVATLLSTIAVRPIGEAGAWQRSGD